MNQASGNEAKRDVGAAPRTSLPCDVCGGATYELRCKIICSRCGYTRDCSDP